MLLSQASTHTHHHVGGGWSLFANGSAAVDGDADEAVFAAGDDDDEDDDKDGGGESSGGRGKCINIRYENEGI